MLCLSATFFMISMVSWLWSTATFVVSNTGASSCCAGATSLCFVFCWNAKLPKFFVKIMHVSSNARLQGSEVMIFHFLSFWCRSAQKSTAAEDQVFSLFVKILVNQEIFLLRSYGCVDVTDLFVSKDVKNTNRFFVQNIHGTKKRSFLIQCLSAVGTECSRNVKSFIFNECR